MHQYSNPIPSRFIIIAAVIASLANPIIAEPIVEFLDATAASKVMMDESVEKYFSKMQSREIQAKTGGKVEKQNIEIMRSACRDYYGDSTLEFSEHEREMLKNSAAFVHELTKDDYPRFAAQPWKFVKLLSRIEGGLPHTRNDCIVLSDRVLQQLTFMHHQDADASKRMIAQLLIHEQIHVMQRMDPELFRALYEETWGFTYVKRMSSHPKLLERQILNPDGVDTAWVFPVGKDEHQRFIQPNIVLAEGQGVPMMPRDFRLVAIELIQINGRWSPKLDEKDQPIIYPLNQFADYREAVGGTGNNYHPNEAFAAIFPRIVLWETKKVEDGIFLKKPDSLTKVEKWAKKAFSNEPAKTDDGADDIKTKLQVSPPADQ